MEPAGGDAPPTTDADILVDVYDSGPALDQAGSVLERTGEVALWDNTLLAYGEGEIITERIADNL
jgi:hypothetical protein